MGEALASVIERAAVGFTVESKTVEKEEAEAEMVAAEKGVTEASAVKESKAAIERERRGQQSA